MVLNSIIIDHDLVTKVMICILSRITTIYTILIITDTILINDTWNFNWNTNNHIFYKLNETRNGVYVSNIAPVACLFTYKFRTNIYKMVKIFQIASKMNNFFQIIKIINVIKLIIHSIKTLDVTTAIIQELYLFNAICNRTPQIANKSKTLIIVLMIINCIKFTADADKMNACQLIEEKKNNCNQYRIITNVHVIIISPIMYSIQRLFVIESQIIWKIVLLENG